MIVSYGPQICETPDKPLQSRASARPHILVVEDEAIVRESNTEALERSGYEVDTAADGDAAWEALSDDTYDLMITDNNMPNLTGMDLLRRLRSARMCMPVIMASGDLPTEEFIGKPWLKPDAMLAKPFTAKQMLDAVKKVLQAEETNGHSS